MRYFKKAFVIYKLNDLEKKVYEIHHNPNHKRIGMSTIPNFYDMIVQTIPTMTESNEQEYLDVLSATIPFLNDL